MKAAIFSKYGPPEVLKLKEVPKPIPKPNEVLIKVISATVTMGDCELRRFDLAPWIWLPVRIVIGIFRPRIKILGQEFAGIIKQVGGKVTEFKPGDEVFCENGMSFGGYAEYVCVHERRGMVPKSENLSFEEAATIPTGGINAVHFIELANIQPGEHILINGAGGSIGTYAVQLAKYQEAEITVVDSEIKLEMLQHLGADHLIDYKNEDFTANGKKYDIIFDIVGKSSFSKSIAALNEGGRYILGNPQFTGMIRGAWLSKNSNKKVIFKMANPNKKNLKSVRNMIIAGILSPVIDKQYPLDKIVDAHKYVDQGLKKGHLIVNVKQD